MNAPLISVLMPTRGHVLVMLESIQSLRSTCSDPSSYELLVRCDFDDPETQAALPDNVIALCGPRVGYRGLHTMYNELAARACGEWLFVWNSDAVMLTRGWDQRVQQCSDAGAKRLHVQSTCDPPPPYGSSFPILRRSFYEVLGHLSAWSHVDTYIGRVLEGLWPVVSTGIYAEHRFQALIEAGDVATLEAREGRPDTSGHGYSHEVQSQIAIDRAKLKLEIT